MIIFRDLDFAVVVSATDPYRVDFDIYMIAGYDFDVSADGAIYFHQKGKATSPHHVNDIENAEVFITGSVKWDGCSNWTMQSNYFHACSRAELARIGEVLGRCFDMAAKLCPNWDASIADVAR